MNFKLAFSILFVIQLNTSYSQSTPFSWLKFIWGFNITNTNTIADINGNTYYSGSFESGYNFNHNPPSVYDLSTTTFMNGLGEFQTYKNAFIQKLDSEGNLLWLHQIGGDNDVIAQRITQDKDGNLLIFGFFSGNVDFDLGAGLFELQAMNPADNFILKLDANGNFLWVKNFGYGSYQNKNITTDYLGNVYAVSAFNSTVDFDPGLGNYELTSNGNADGYILKLDASGDFIWAKQVGGIGVDFPISISADSNSIYSAGYFSNTVDFDPSIAVFNLNSSNYYIQKLDLDGNFTWAIGAPANISDCILSNNQKLILTGYFSNTVDFDSSPANNSLSSVGNNDVYISQLNSDGEFQWVHQISGMTDNDRSVAINSDLDGNIYTIGNFYGEVNFNPFDNLNVKTSFGNYDIFVHKLDSVGNFKWVHQIGGASSQEANSITCDNFGSVYSTGSYYETTNFDPGVSDTILSWFGTGEKVFILKLNQCENTSVLDIQQACGSFTWIDGITYLNSNFSATHTMSTSLGCDSVITLNLTLNHSSDTILFVDALDSYTAPSGVIFHDSGIIQDTIFTALGCDSVLTIHINMSFTGIDEISDSKLYTLYPNPTYGDVFINSMNSNEILEIKLVTIEGKCIETKNEFTQNNMHLSFIGESGVYLLTIIDINGRYFTYRILKNSESE